VTDSADDVNTAGSPGDLAAPPDVPPDASASSSTSTLTSGSALPRRDPFTMKVPPRPAADAVVAEIRWWRMRGLPGGVLLPADVDDDSDGLLLPEGAAGEVERLLGEAQPGAALERLAEETGIPTSDKATLQARAWLMDGRLDDARAILGAQTGEGAAARPALGDAALALAENDTDRAEARVLEARDQKPRDVGAAYLHALVRVARGDMAQGAELLSAVARAVPSHAVARFQLGQILFSQGDPARAGTLYEMAWQLQPGFVSPPLALADMLVESRQYGEALGILERVCAAAPNSLPPRQLQLRILVEIGERAQAIELGRMLHEQVPHDHDTALLYADALIDADRTADADALLKRVLEQPGLDATQNVRARRLLARIALVEKRVDEAIATLTAASEVAPPASCGEVCLELVHVGVAQNRMAEVDVGLTLLLRSSDVSSLVSGALLARQHHLPARARALAERARALVPGTAAAAQLDGFIAGL
jgi:tetratricopeptide (TPR) repeat protein